MKFLNNQPARLCACCGQQLPSESRAAIALDETVLRLCNRAFEIAARRSSAEVEIAHLACAFATSPVAAVAFDTFEIEASEITDFAYAWLSKTSVAGQGLEPHASRELIELLSRAEQLARGKGRDAAAIADVIEALVCQAHDLVTAEFVGDALRSSLQERKIERIEHGNFERAFEHKAGQHAERRSTEYSLQYSTERQVADGILYSDHRSSQDLRTEDAGYANASGYASDHEASPQDAYRASARTTVKPSPVKPQSTSRLLTATYSFSQPIAHSETTADHYASADRDESVADDWDEDQQYSSRGSDFDRAESSRANGAWAGRSSSRPSASRSSSTSYSSSSSSQSSSRQGGRFFRRRSLRALEAFRNAASRDDAPHNRQRQSTRGSEHSQMRSPLMSRASGREFAADDADTRRRDRAREQDRERNYERERDFDRDRSRDRSRRRDRDRESDSDRDEASSATGERQKRFYLAMDDDVVRAPSIGPKTATKLNALGIVTVRDLLEVDAHDLADRARARFLTPQKILDWQAQARLVCTVPWLRGTHAQLLVGAGFNSVETILEADSATLCSQILNFATTRDGQSILRSGPPPDIERIAQWVGFAEQAEPERVAA